MAKPFRVDASTDLKMHYKQPLESENLGQWDLIDPNTGSAREPTVVIEAVELFVPPVQRFKRMPDGRKVPEKLNKYTIRFAGKRKALVAGSVVQASIASLHGTKLQGWIGKRITLYVDPDVMFGRKKLGGIRVRSDAPQDEPTEDPLDNAVDERIKAIHDEAFGREPGEEG